MTEDLMYASVFLALALMALVPSILATRPRTLRRRTIALDHGLTMRPIGRARWTFIRTPEGRRQS